MQLQCKFRRRVMFHLELVMSLISIFPALPVAFQRASGETAAEAPWSQVSKNNQRMKVRVGSRRTYPQGLSVIQLYELILYSRTFGKWRRKRPKTDDSWIKIRSRKWKRKKKRSYKPMWCIVTLSSSCFHTIHRYLAYMKFGRLLDDDDAFLYSIYYPCVGCRRHFIVFDSSIGRKNRRAAAGTAIDAGIISPNKTSSPVCRHMFR